ARARHRREQPPPVPRDRSPPSEARRSISPPLPPAAAEMTAWRHDLHAHPDFGFELTRAAAFVADKLRSFGFDEVAEGVGRVGVAGTLRRGSSGRAIALRADMDALRIEEQGDRPHPSPNPRLI